MNRRPREAGEKVNRSVSWLAKSRCGATRLPGPKFFRIGRSIYYSDEELDAWIERCSSKVYASTSEYEVDPGAAMSVAVRQRKRRMQQRDARRKRGTAAAEQASMEAKPPGES